MHLRNGAMFFLALATILSQGCRKSVPPPIEICTADPAGGAECIESDGTRKFRLPSELNNYWMTNQADMAHFTAWCYDAEQNIVEARMAQISAELKK